MGLDLSEKKKLIDQLVMDYVNNMDSDEESEEEKPPKVAPKKKIKKEDEDEDDEDINDDSNDSDWGVSSYFNLCSTGGKCVERKSRNNNKRTC